MCSQVPFLREGVFGASSINNNPASLVLASGEIFKGSAFGCSDSAVGEVVFNTAMTGYQEILTDPSYAGQIVCMTTAHVGIVGTNPLDEEAPHAQAKAMIVRSLSPTMSNWRGNDNLDTYCKDQGVVGISELDTRSLTQLLREQGAVNGCVVHSTNTKEALKLARQCPPMTGNDLGASVGTEKPILRTDGNWEADTNAYQQNDPTGPSIAVLDCGAKQSILRELVNCGLQVTVIPYATPAARIATDFTGLVISNGPGDPEPLDVAIATTTTLLNQGFPLLGICLGHQILAQAAGAKSVKLKFGHHGANHPVLEEASKKVFITSQNHGFAIARDSIPASLEVTHISLFDGTVQGLRHRTLPALSFQGHPEASPGPREMAVIFTQFADLVRNNAQNS